MAQDNLKIADAEYIYAEKIFTAYLTTLQEVSTEYASLTQKISEQAFEAPKTSVKINELGLQMQEITRQISTVIENLEGESKEFIGTIDELDQFIY